MNQVVERDAAIHDLLDHQYVAVFERNVEIFGDAHLAGAGLTFSVTGNTHEIDAYIALDSPRQIGQEKACALEDTNQLQRIGGIVGGNLLTELNDALRDPVGGEEHAECRIG